LPLRNPLTEDQNVMRTSLLPGLLTTMFKNSAQRNENLQLFEQGKVFIAADDEPLPDEVEMVSGLWTGIREETAWYTKGRPVDFYDIKGVVETLCAGLNVFRLRFSVPGDGQCPYLKPGRCAAVSVGEDLVGFVGEIAPEVLSHYDLKQTAYCFDLDFDRLMDAVSLEKRAKPISRFPSTNRDVALILDEALEVKRVLNFIADQGHALIHDVTIFDVYTGPPVPDGMKSVALRFTYQSFEGSLTDRQVNDIHQSVIHKTLQEFDGQLPSG
jgi:phenylalanyl-tRNA synthetase beta chain